MQKVLIIGIISLPMIMFLAIFGQNTLINFRENENSMIDSENSLNGQIKKGINLKTSVNN